MRVWRIVRSRYAQDAFSGEGARRYAGRWHHAGHPVVYTATSRPLALLEVLVHVDFEDAPTDLVLIPADVPDECIEALDDDDLPEGWDHLPTTETSRDLGSTWQRERHSLGLLVPSVVLPAERNVLLSPSHPDFDRVEIGRPEPLDLDDRLVRSERKARQQVDAIVSVATAHQRLSGTDEEASGWAARQGRMGSGKLSRFGDPLAPYLPLPGLK